MTPAVYDCRTETPVDGGGRLVRNAETVVLDDRRCELWSGYRIQPVP